MPTTQVNLRIGNPFTELPETGSTNTHVLDLIRTDGNPTHGAAFMAHAQTHGKGQRGKIWHTEPGKNMALSIALRPQPASLGHQFELSVVVALAVHDVLKKESADCYIKWPNDIYCRGKKVCGILIENIIQGSTWQWAVAGIGINLNQTQFEPALSRASSLQLLTGKAYNIVAFAKNICASLQNRYVSWQEGDFATLMQEYNLALYKRGEKVQLKKGNDIFECLIEKVDDQGYLYVSGALKERFTFGEVEWLQVTDCR